MASRVHLSAAVTRKRAIITGVTIAITTLPPALAVEVTVEEGLKVVAAATG